MKSAARGRRRARARCRAREAGGARPAAGQDRRAALLRRPHRRRSRRGARHFSRHREAPLDDRARVAQEGTRPVAEPCERTTPDRWQRVGALFDRALATPPPERQSLVRASTEPSDVQDEVLDAPEVARRQSRVSRAGGAARRRHAGRRLSHRSHPRPRRHGRGVSRARHAAASRRRAQGAAAALVPGRRMRARLRQEARAAAALSHPSIATVFALEEIGDQIFIASEYLEGRTLREEMKSRSLRPSARDRDRARPSPRRCWPRTIAASCIAI